MKNYDNYVYLFSMLTAICYEAFDIIHFGNYSYFACIL